jgi:hypothetical protein
MALGSEPDIVLSTDVVFAFAPIDVLPRGERDFPFPAACPKEKFITHALFRIHCLEQFLQFFFGVRDCGFVLDDGHLVPRNPCFDAVLFQQEEYKVAGFRLF